MDISRRYPSIHWIWGASISFVYEVHPRIVVKVPKSGGFERQRFQKELAIYQILSQYPPWPSIVQCFLLSGSGIFLDYMSELTATIAWKRTSFWKKKKGLSGPGEPRTS